MKKPQMNHFAGLALAMLGTVPVLAQSDTTITNTKTTTVIVREEQDTMAPPPPAPPATMYVPDPEPEVLRTELGFRYMPTFTDVDIRSASNGTVVGEFVLGHGFGGFLGYNFSENTGLMLEVIYSSLSQRYTDEYQIERKLNLNYIHIPLLFNLNSGKFDPVNVSVTAGPQVGINVGSSLKTEGNPNSDIDTVQAVLAVKAADFGLAYGAGIDFGKDVRIGLGFRGVLGILDISDDNKTTTTNEYYILDRSKVRTYAAYVSLSAMF